MGAGELDSDLPTCIASNLQMNHLPSLWICFFLSFAWLSVLFVSHGIYFFKIENDFIGMPHSLARMEQINGNIKRYS